MIDSDDVSNYNPGHVLPESPETIQTIRKWLQPTEYDGPGGEFRRHLASHVAGTGEWLASSSTYEQWLQSADNGLLWIKGSPGSGKSVMAAYLISEITKANPSNPVLFFFFRQIVETNHRPEAVLRDWMDQLLPYSPPLQRQLKGYIDAQRSLESIAMQDMWKDLHAAFASLQVKVFCVVDALDEMDYGHGHDSFLEALGGLGQWQPANVKVLVTSRPTAAVESSSRTATVSSFDWIPAR